MVKVAILGGSGYTALELIKLLLRHPAAEIVAVTSRREGSPWVEEIHPSLTSRLHLRMEPFDADKLLAEMPYLSPEQVDPNAFVDHLSDIYSLGAVVYARLTGQPPFKGADPEETRQLLEQFYEKTDAGRAGTHETEL